MHHTYCFSSVTSLNDLFSTQVNRVDIFSEKKPLSEVQRGQIVALHNKGLSEQRIAAKLKVSKTAVHQSIKKFKQYGSYKDLHRSGRPRKTTIRDDHLIKKIVTRSPLSSINKVRAALLERKVTVGRMTVSQCLSWQFGLKSYKPARKPSLTPAIKAKRLAFAKKHQDWMPAQRSKHMFSDKSTLQQFVVRKRHVRQPCETTFSVFNSLLQT